MLKQFVSITFLIIIMFSFCGCKGENKNMQDTSVVVKEAKQMNTSVQEVIKQLLEDLPETTGKLSDSAKIKSKAALDFIYKKKEYAPFWSNEEALKTKAAQLIKYIDTVHRHGLFKADYNYGSINALNKVLEKDSAKRKDAVLWAKLDLMLSNAFVLLVQDLKQGRLLTDSAKMLYAPQNFDFFSSNLESFTGGKALSAVMDSLQPRHKGYWELKKAIVRFTDSMDRRNYTYLLYPNKDSLGFLKQFQRRLGESGIALEKGQPLDSFGLNTLVKLYQKKKQLKQDGKITSSLVRVLNNTDQEKFKRIAVTLDRYKLLPEKMPEQFIWVNLPGFYMEVMNADTVVLESKIICGKPETPTPQITSAITDMVLNPTWTVPSSIIEKEMLPGLKRNPGYLARRGLYLLNGKGEKIDPYKINWAKYKKGIPYRIQQGSGDNNALGVIKFNFSNKYDVYLHDTNARGLFKRAYRSLSHGCVRVQEWKKLAFFIARNDSLKIKPTDTLRYTTDSLVAWLDHGGYRKVLVNNKIPLFIRYFTTEGKNGKLKFNDDIYGDDRELRERYFSVK